MYYKKKCQKKPRKGIVGGIHVFNDCIFFSILVSKSLILFWACCSSSNVNGEDGFEDFLIVCGIPNIWSISCWITLRVKSKHLFKNVRTLSFSETSFWRLTIFSIKFSLDFIDETYLIYIYIFKYFTKENLLDNLLNNMY